MTEPTQRWERSRARISRIRETKAGEVYEGWRVSWYREGKRLRKRFQTKSEAESHAQRLNAEASSTESFRLLVTPQQAASVARAEELLGPIGVSLEVAVAEYAEARRKLGGVSLVQAAGHWLETRAVAVSVSVKKAVAEFLKSKLQDGTGERQVASLRGYLNAFAKACLVTCDGLNSKLIDAYLRENQKDRDWSGLTRNHHRAAISNFTGWAKQKGYLPRTWSEMEFVGVAARSKDAVGVFTPEEGTKLLATSHGPARTLLAIGMFSGIRPSEICRLTWEDIDWERGEIHVGKQKVRTAGNRIAPLLPALRSILDPLKCKGSIFPYLPDWAARLSAGAGKKAKVKWIHDGPRHSFVSYRLALLRDIARVSEETGTSASTLRKHYRRPVSAEVAQKWFEISPETGPKRPPSEKSEEEKLVVSG